MSYQAEKYLLHRGHRLEVGTYGDPIVNVAIECMDCNEVLTDEDVGHGPECDGMAHDGPCGQDLGYDPPCTHDRHGDPEVCEDCRDERAIR